MRDAITEVREHGAKKFKTLFNSDVSLNDQQAAIKKIRATNVHEKYAEVRYYESPRKFTFKSPAEEKARKAAIDKAAKEAAEKDSEKKTEEKSEPVETKKHDEPNPLTELKQ